MPILNIEFVTELDGKLPDGLASKIAQSAGRVFGSLPGRVWVKIQPIPYSAYAENDSEQDVYPVFVTVLKARLPAQEVLQQEAMQLTEAIAGACQRPPSNVHIIYLPEGTGRVAFGGKLLGD